MNISQHSRRYHALRVSEDDLTRMHQQLAEHIPDVKIKCECSDGSTLEMSGLEELLGYENPGFRRLTSVSFSGHRQSPSTTVDVKLATPEFPFTPTCTAYLSSENEHQLGSLPSDLEARFDQMKPWYSVITRTKLSYLFASIPILYVLAKSAGTFVAKIQGYWVAEEATKGRLNDWEALIGMAALFGGLYLAGAAADVVKGRLFPPYVIAIGREREVQVTRERWVYFLFVVVAIGIAINVGSQYIMSTA